MVEMEKWRTLKDYASEIGYNGIAYSVMRLCQSGLLVGKTLAKSRHQDVGTL